MFSHSDDTDAIILAKEYPDKVIGKMLGITEKAVNSRRQAKINPEKTAAARKRYNKKNWKQVLTTRRKYIQSISTNDFRSRRNYATLENEVLLAENYNVLLLSSVFQRTPQALSTQLKKLKAGTCEAINDDYVIGIHAPSAYRNGLPYELPELEVLLSKEHSIEIMAEVFQRCINDLRKTLYLLLTGYSTT